MQLMGAVQIEVLTDIIKKNSAMMFLSETGQ